MEGMTGRELILYIIENNLENEPIFKDGKFIGFMTDMEAAVKFGVGPGTIRAWVHNGYVHGVRIGNTIYIPANTENPIERTKNEKVITNTSDMSVRNNDVPHRTDIRKSTGKCIFVNCRKH